MKKETMNRITQKEYFENFGADVSAQPSQAAIQRTTDVAKTFEIVLATRQFEIQMYWTRTAYFWTLIAAAFAGYFALQASSEASPDSKSFLGFTISVIGAVLSLGWGLANKGSNIGKRTGRIMLRCWRTQLSAQFSRQ